MPVCLADPPTIAICVATPVGGGARHPRAVDPRTRQHLFSVGSATAIQVQTSDCEHLAWSHPHLIAAEEHALRIRCPWTKPNADRCERAARECVGALLSGAREHS